MRHIVQRLASAGTLSLLLAGCAQGTTLDRPAGASHGNDGSAGGGGAGGVEPPGADASAGGGGAPRDPYAWTPPPDSSVGPCSDVTHHIYLVSPRQEFFSFHPASLELHRIGKLRCGGGSPFSMAVDRNGVAWIVTWEASVLRLDIATGACETTPYRVGDGEPFRSFGMAFVADGVPDQETLYVREGGLHLEADAVSPARTLGIFDTHGSTVLPVGEGAGANADLTGTGDGHLFGFVKHPESGAGIISEFDRATGAALSERPLPGVTIGTSWAFARWGGDFWFFVTNDIDVFTSSVYRYDPDAAAPPELVVSQLPTAVIGAGVSTCAPTEVPR
ncbi:hypothetical protein WMF37_17460 [Sorangium sp. So ce291]|uniref:hypothetical protein n=1 Tax=Sorangium sp. So ce291 TaxID=3133294 RepID=UPI003F64476D